MNRKAKWVEKKWCFGVEGLKERVMEEDKGNAIAKEKKRLGC